MFPFTPAPFKKISPYVVAGDPASGLLPRVEPKPPGVKGQGDKRVQAYNFRICLTDVADNLVPIEKPATYNPLDYELLARLIATMKDVKPGPRCVVPMGLRGKGLDLGINFELVPNLKTDSNCGSEFGSDMFGSSYDWPEADYAKRQEIWDLHKNYTLGLLWFLGHDERIPQPVRDEMRRRGLPKDEFADNGHWPRQLYVCEARRMISEYVVTEHEAKGSHPAADSVALASYPLDSHGVTLYVDEQGVLHRERGFYVGTKPFTVSYQAIRPKKQECENLLVPGCLSASHAAYGSIRMEPVFMMLGHAAGAAAAMAAREDTAVQDVPYAKLREQLLADGQILEPDAPKTTPNSDKSQEPQAVVASVAEQLRVLERRKLIDDAEAWAPRLMPGGACPGEIAAELFVKLAKSLDPAAADVPAALRVLKQRKVLNSPEFWETRLTAGKSCPAASLHVVVRNYLKVAQP
ncbi:MAG: FAD-dependent oxidoreductase [Pirellulales bacterium]